MLKYVPDGDICAVHDKLLFLGPDPEKLTVEDRKRLEELRVHWDEREESWYIFT